MAVNTSTNSAQENCSKPSFLRVLLSFSSVVVVVCISFLGGFFMNSVYRSNHQKLKSKPIVEMRIRRLKPDFEAQLLSSFKAKNLEENLR